MARAIVTDMAYLYLIDHRLPMLRQRGWQLADIDNTAPRGR